MSDKVYDFCIIGVGACGGLLLKQLAEQGYSVIGLDAGPRYNPATDFVNDEAEMLKLFWNEPRTFRGKDPVHVMSGFGVGGGTLVWCGVTPRYHAADFRTKTLDGVGVDWPIGYKDLEPYYDRVEREFGVSGNAGEDLWEVPRGPYPMPAFEWSWACQVMAKGVEKAGARPLHGPLAITSEAWKGREACVKCGFCISGCPSTGKGCTLTGFVPEAEAHGAEVRAESFVYNIVYDAKQGRVTGVEYFDANVKPHRVNAKAVIVTAHPMETARLLLLSKSSSFPEGLANSSGLVGKNFMVHWDASVYGVFEQRMNAFKGPIMGNLIVQDWHDTDSKRDFARGFVLESFLPHPFYFGVAGPAVWGQELKDMIKGYSHTAGWWICGESLPNDNNTITLDPDVKDHRDLPVVRSTHEWADNDKKMMQYASQVGVTTLEAAGAKKTYLGVTMSAHPMGTARMGSNPKASVVNSYGQSHDVPNLFVCDSSVFPTGGVVNQTLTAMAIASRAGDFMVEAAKRGDL
jgi:choline dehydrogenase-like flavoprotein